MGRAWQAHGLAAGAIFVCVGVTIATEAPSISPGFDHAIKC
jgi:hypothetical protein